MACEAAAKVFDIKDLLKRAAEKVGDSLHDADEGVHVDDHDAMAVAAPTSPKKNSPSKFRTSMISSPRNERSREGSPRQRRKPRRQPRRRGLREKKKQSHQQNGWAAVGQQRKPDLQKMGDRVERRGERKPLRQKLGKHQVRSAGWRRRPRQRPGVEQSQREGRQQMMRTLTTALVWRMDMQTLHMIMRRP